MERHEIEAVLTLAEELHFGRTAERLRVSTARISQTIKRLERRIGVPLFERTSRRVTLTAVGQQLVADVRPAHAQIEAGLARAISAGRGTAGELRVGFVGAAAGQLLLHVTDVFQARHPECTVDVSEVQVGDAFDRLRADEVQLVLGCFPIREPGLVAGPVLLTEARLVAVPAGHPFAGRASVSVEELADGTLVRAPCSLPDVRGVRMPERTPAGRTLDYGPSAETLQEVLTLVGAGKGIFAVGAQAARFYARPDVAYVPLHDAPPLEWGTIWRADNVSARVRAFNQAAVDTVHARGGPALAAG